MAHANCLGEGPVDPESTSGQVSPVSGRRSLGTMSRVAQRFRASGVESAYLVAALVFGLILVVLTPPFQTYDEHAHYQRAWSVAEGQLLAHPDGSVTLPDNVASLPGDLHFLEVFRGQQHFDAALLPHLLWQPI